MSGSLQSFTLALGPAGDEGSAYRTQNDPSAPYQRSSIIERTGPVDIACDLLGTVHGAMSPESKDLATLIVMRFDISVRDNGRRIKSIEAVFGFDAEDAEGHEPAVAEIGPRGTFSAVPTTQTVDTKQSAELALAAPPLAGATVGAKVGWEKATSRQAKDRTRVSGDIRYVGKSYGEKNGAQFIMLENKQTQSGVPTLLKVAILLKRRDERKFNCSFKIHASYDAVGSMAKLFGSTPKDDPILFDPQLPPSKMFKDYDAGNLGSADLDALWRVTTETVLDDATAHHQQRHT